MHSLDGPRGLVTDTKGMLDVASNFYKNLFRSEERSGVHLNPSFFSDGEKVNTSENDILEAPFSEEEIKRAVFESYSDGAPGPDGVPFFFYQHFWDLVKKDLIAMFEVFHKGELAIHRLNFAMLTLIPKEVDASCMKKFKPISLLNCGFKIFTKVLTDRMAKILQRLIASNQSDF